MAREEGGHLGGEGDLREGQWALLWALAMAQVSGAWGSKETGKGKVGRAPEERLTCPEDPSTGVDMARRSQSKCLVEERT